MKNKLFLILIFCEIIISCFPSNCKENEQKAKNRECMLIIKDQISSSSPYLNAKGINPFTKEECKCKDEGRWWVQYAKYMEIGDTLIKKKGELIFSIHKKDTILSFEWGSCSERNQFVPAKMPQHLEKYKNPNY